MLSLKSNIWKVVGEVKYTFTSKVGILSNGALHWIVRDNENMKKRLILSYDLCKQEFKEIPQPDDARYECTFDSFLGIITEHLCIYQYSCVWLMKSYDSWELLPRDRVIKNDVVHTLRMTRDDRFFNYDKSSFCKVSQVHFNFGLPVFVQSLVSPHVNGRPKHSSDDKMNAKIDKFDAVGAVKIANLCVNQGRFFCSWIKCRSLMLLKQSKWPAA
ncbi:hypothetical protein QVD17_01068 [Tagetes erecta]|uniref:F-box protein n=1 Tax=Tagetes erecta TaxID=13708 RepID=A0AAD8L5R9_TARER|nr:hypothetical protein QVD17_01068 [Tagetes erecta]